MSHTLALTCSFAEHSEELCSAVLSVRLTSRGSAEDSGSLPRAWVFQEPLHIRVRAQQEEGLGKLKWNKVEKINYQKQIY